MILTQQYRFLIEKQTFETLQKKLIRTISLLSPIIAILIVDFYCYANRYTSPIYGRDYYSCFTASNSPEHVTFAETRFEQKTI